MGLSVEDNRSPILNLFDSKPLHFPRIGLKFDSIQVNFSGSNQ